MKQVKVGGVLIEQDGKFIFIKASVGPTKGLWNTPGGKLDEGESFEQAAVREAKEESGYDVELGQLINTYYFNIGGEEQVEKKIFAAKIVGGDLQLQPEEILDAIWAEVDNLPEEEGSTVSVHQSVKDLLAKKFDQVYHVDRIA
ncbi:NUDIX hydrolase [Patescibacteria group bacterium]|nr:NUDIX hydrolase [Patescibacteria group bacterium]MBU1906755.1 NUDIX hydrolase [Patescibacteria group bacterium]